MRIRIISLFLLMALTCAAMAYATVAPKYYLALGDSLAASMAWPASMLLIEVQVANQVAAPAVTRTPNLH
jgi:peptidoglycan/LPS O-acetylase OafA/YrhL